MIYFYPNHTFEEYRRDEQNRGLTVRCASCGELVDLNEAIVFEGKFYHEECRPDLVQCAWCGEWLYKYQAKKIGGSYYHPVCYIEMGDC